MDALERLKIAVFSKQKTLAEIYRRHSGRSVFDYVKSWPVLRPENGLNENFAVAVFALAGRIYGATVAKELVDQLKIFPLVSTIDHHGILGSPFFLNSNLIFSLRPEAKYLICFSTAGVSLNNHTWPGSLLVTDAKNLRLRRFSFFPEKQKRQTVFAANKLADNNFHRMIAKIQSANFITPGKKINLASLIAEISALAEIKDQPDFSHQACLISHRLWSKVFPHAPKLIYLPLETLISDLLIQNLRNNQNIFSKLFFTPEGRQYVEKYFQGLKGAFPAPPLNKAGDTGSFLFWGVDGQGRRIHLRRVGAYLAGENFSLSLEAEAVISALENKTIYPTSLVCFLVVLFYQLTCLGGFNQVNWLTEIKQKFLELLQELGEKELVNRVSLVVTDNFAETNLVFSSNGEKMYKPTLLDIFLKQDPEIYQKIVDLAGKITLGASVDSLLPEIYKVITPVADRDAVLLKFNDAEIAKMMGISGV